MEAVQVMGYDKPTPVQEKAIPDIMKGCDMIACAQTGTGKTAAYILPLIHNLLNNENRNTDHRVRSVIIAPTRELALQIDQQFEGFSYYCPVSSIPVYGGNDSAAWDQQKNALKSGADVIIATPGRLISHIKLGYVDLSKVDTLILDEADRMLDMGFVDDIMKIIEEMPKKRQTLLFSATMPHKIRELSAQILNEPKHINIALAKPAEGILQAAYMLHESQKISLIKDLLLEKKEESVLIFTSTKSNVNQIVQQLVRNKISARGLHSDFDQSDREQILMDYKNRKFYILVATSILSRGIDIEDINLVLNYNVPGDSEEYVHRIGRTARASSTGVALTFITKKDQDDFFAIEEFIGKTIHKIPVPEHLGEAPEYSPTTGKKKKYKKDKHHNKSRFNRKKYPRKDGDKKPK